MIQKCTKMVQQCTIIGHNKPIVWLNQYYNDTKLVIS